MRISNHDHKKAVIFKITALIFIAVLKNSVDFYTLLIGEEGTKTPVGVWFRGDPAGACAEEARRNTHGKRSVWSGNQQASLTEQFL
jgi:hypothetical protein